MSTGSLRISSTLAGGRITIDLGAVAANWRMLADRVGETVATAAVVKGDGYGIGLEAAAETLAEAGCHTFFVALAEEGVRLRHAVHDAAIYVLDGLIPGSADTLITGRPPPGAGLHARDRGMGGSEGGWRRLRLRDPRRHWHEPARASRSPRRACSPSNAT